MRFQQRWNGGRFRLKTMLFIVLGVFFLQLVSSGSSWNESQLQGEDPLVISGVNYSFTNFTPSSIPMNKLNCSVAITSNTTLVPGTERFGYALANETPSSMISTHDDDFSNGILDNFWEVINPGNGFFNESGGALTILDTANTVWASDGSGGIDATAPAIFQDINGNFKVNCTLNASSLHDTREDAGMLLSWEGGYLKLSIHLDNLQQDLIIDLHVYMNATATVLNSINLGEGKAPDIHLERAGDTITLNIWNNGAAENVSNQVNIPSSLKVGVYAARNGEITIDGWEINPSVSFNISDWTILVENVVLDYKNLYNNTLNFQIEDTENNTLNSPDFHVDIDASQGSKDFIYFYPENYTSPVVESYCFLNLFYIQLDLVHLYTEAFATTSDGTLPDTFYSPHSDAFSTSGLKPYWNKDNSSNFQARFENDSLILQDVTNTSIEDISSLPWIYQTVPRSFSATFKLDYASLSEGAVTGFKVRSQERVFVFYIRKQVSNFESGFYEYDRNGTLLNSLNVSIPFTRENLWLKIAEDDGLMELSYSQNGDTYAQYTPVFSLPFHSNNTEVGIFTCEDSTICIDYWEMTPSIEVILKVGLVTLHVEGVHLDESGDNYFRFKINSSDDEVYISNVFYARLDNPFLSNASLLLTNGNDIQVMNLDGEITWNVPMTKVLDKELMPNGNILVTRGAPGFGEVVEITPQGSIAWNVSSAGGVDFNWPHDADYLPNGNFLVADTLNDRVIEINRSGDVEWEWHVADSLNPTLFNNTPAYVNDADLLPGGIILTCLRDYNMIMEIDRSGNILWSYGDFSNTSMLHGPHNPDKLENGNIMVCDSENGRIVEISPQKEIAWLYDPGSEGGEGLGWPRDADVIDNSMVLISDSKKDGNGSNSLRLVNITSKDVLWEFTTNGANYEADFLKNNSIHVKILSPENSTYKLSRVIDIAIESDDSLVDVFYNIFDNSTGKFIYGSPRAYSGISQEILEQGHSYTVYAWCNSTTGGSGWPQDDSVVISQTTPSIVSFNVDLAENITTNEMYEGTTMLSQVQPSRLVEVNSKNEVIWEYEYHPPVDFDVVEVYLYDFDRMPNDDVVYGILLKLRDGRLYHIMEEVNRDHEIVWRKEFNGTIIGDNHDIDYLPETDVFLVASSNDDAVFEINRSGDIVWSWYADNYFTRTTQDDWTHLNDVQRLDNGNTLISLRNLDTVVEVNESGDIVWQFGDPINGSILNHQHHPTRLPNGNTIICDSDNDRVIEIDMNGTIVWNTEDFPTLEIEWPRSVNPLPNGNLIILTPVLSRVIEINRSGDILWENNLNFIFTAERIDRHAPVPEISVANNSRYNDTFNYLASIHETDLNKTWFNFRDTTSSSLAFAENISGTSLDNITLPWGIYELITWTSDTGMINIYQGNAPKVNIGVFRNSYFTISPILRIANVDFEGKSMQFSWDGVYCADNYSLYYSSTNISTTDGSAKLAVTTGETTVEMDVLPPGTYFFVVVAHNQTTSSPASNCIVVIIAPVVYPVGALQAALYIISASLAFAGTIMLCKGRPCKSSWGGRGMGVE
ncbi:MAG: aryl-sulfate sulfotransferase [Promethearchaeota archaeon]